MKPYQGLAVEGRAPLVLRSSTWVYLARVIGYKLQRMRSASLATLATEGNDPTRGLRALNSHHRLCIRQRRTKECDGV